MRVVAIMVGLIVVTAATSEVQILSAESEAVELSADPKRQQVTEVDRMHKDESLNLGETEGTAALDAEGMKVFREKFLKLASSMKEPRLKESATLMEKMSLDALQGSRGAGGMKLVYKRIKELEEETRREMKDDLKYIVSTRQSCEANMEAASVMMTTATGNSKDNDAQMQDDKTQITRNRMDFEESKRTTSKIHRELLALFKERALTIDETKERVDERNKALDVLVKAIGMVCQKFKRFQTTAQCARIKATPDVDEPEADELPSNATATIRNDKRKTSFFEEDQFSKWSAMYEQDDEKVGKINPEGLPLTPKQEERMKQLKQLGPGYHEEELAESNEESLKDGALSTVEVPELNMLKTMSEQPMKSRYGAPLQELVLALQEGESKKAINIVQVLIDVKDEIYTEQVRDKKQHQAAMDDFYTRAWQLQSQLAEQKRTQDEKMADTATRRQRMYTTLADTEQQRQLQGQQRQVMVDDQKRCATEESEYGMRNTLRQEDLENLAKLQSLLRSLYDQKFPVACRKGILDGPDGEKLLCSGEDKGMCIYRSVQGDEQRCSCNAGYYGVACEFTMCPGLGKVPHRHDTEAACSGRGFCDNMSGTCKDCRAGFFHGSKQGCELTRCPGSGENLDISDDRCSGHGECDNHQGRCMCDVKYSGDSCFHLKCPASNSVLYTFKSASACDGHGACEPQGTCSCQLPFYGQYCEKKHCPANCMGRGTCNKKTGRCACKGTYFGPQCEFQTCPEDCNSAVNGGWCDNLTGKCLCKYGHGGDGCKKVHRCPASTGSSHETNWYTLWDKPGWALCPAGQSLFALYRTDCNALSCVNSAKCSPLCEESSKNVESAMKVRHCYHSLKWYDSFDEKGWSECEPNYFVSGLYRSCDSLYCLQMAKCCSYQNSRWADCEEVNWDYTFEYEGWAKVPSGKWIVGFWRSAGHQLENIDKAKACTYARGF